MRKLARALWHVGRGATFDPRKLFDTRRLGLSADAIASAKEITASPLGIVGDRARIERIGAAQAGELHDDQIGSTALGARRSARRLSRGGATARPACSLGAWGSQN